MFGVMKIVSSEETDNRFKYRSHSERMRAIEERLELEKISRPKRKIAQWKLNPLSRFKPK